MKKYLIASLAALLFSSCGKDEKPIDMEYPEIVVTADSFPLQCSVLQRGTTLQFKALFRDNAELGGFSLDIHHNFDHHTHSTEVNSCVEDPVKSPVKPMLLIQTFPIPDGLTEYEGTAEIEIPADIDPGDYHFMIRLTDDEGWQTLQGLSIKIQ
ncbi:DUF4625 domain-containing protein [Algoriphagus sp. H41]|uniref:DUF4625 domain-containing protein n=1 Tax=Algoriphagus oliviformis TaxID=2811231 RepID=A0ABS3C4Q7_9BACT|nr:DUF4625 domain-containing protein [Algoriphagus oliviformis]MBN7811830.1 DUF4625 domain-containing protein [Algoriphagus oliviformis]